jgi:phosphatidylglycerophosphatase A
MAFEVGGGDFDFHFGLDVLVAKPSSLRQRDVNWDRPILWLSQGFGAGRMPFAPGTWGSLLGIPFLALLLWTGSGWVAVAGFLGGCGLSVYCSGRAERILGQTDPGSVVLDEIVAIPLCFVSWIGMAYWRTGSMPGPEALFRRDQSVAIVTIVVLFRLFDIWKPWPVRESQRLRGGWGVTVDDLLAACYVNLVSLPVLIYL